MVRGLSDLAQISQMRSLEELQLQFLRDVVQLPDLSTLVAPSTLTLETMRGVTDLRPLLRSPSLRTVRLIDMSQLTPEDVGVLSGLASLKEVHAGLGNLKRNALAQSLALTKVPE